MAQTTSININYQGKRAAGYIAGAIAGGVMITGNHISTLWGVKNSINVPVMKLDDVIVPYATDFSAAGTLELSDKKLTPEPLSVMLELPTNVIEALYESEQLKAGMSNTIVPMTFEQFLIKYIQKIVQNKMDYYIWNSDTSGTGAAAAIDGLLVQIIAAVGSGINSVSGTTLTATNILDELSKVYLAKPEAISGEEANFRIFCSKKSESLLRVKLYGMTGREVKESKTLPFDPETLIVSVPGFPNNTFVGTNVNNIFFAGDAESDTSSVNIVDMRQSTNDNKYRFRMDFKLDTKFAFANEIVYYAH